MKVKEFDSYRAPRRKPWGAILAVLLMAAGGVWYWVRDAPAPLPSGGELPAPAAKPSPSRGDAPASADAVPVAMPASISMQLETAAQLAAADKLLDARRQYLETLRQTQDVALRRHIEGRLAPINTTLVLSPRPMPEKEEYLVKRGDSLGAIANRYGTTIALIQRNNRMTNPNLVKIGDRLRVFTGKFELLANKTTHEMEVRMNGEFFKRYKVGTGVYGRTPVGTFAVREKIAEPTWWPPDGREVPFGHKDNILGTRWMSVRATGETPDVRGYGIHGTWEPDSVGKASSAGCLRMINAEVEELFVYIPIGTPLRIEE